MQSRTIARFVLPALLTALALAAPGCGDSGKPGSAAKTGTTGTTVAGADGSGIAAGAGATVSAFQYDFPADVPFDAAEWATSADYEPIGDPRAVKDDGSRPFRMVWASFPPTLRTDGPNSNLTQISIMHGLMFESLVQLHPETEEFIPSLASHWRIEDNEDGKTQTFWFRINEKARWADGSPVTAADVYYSFWHRIQQDRKDPSNVMVYGSGYEMPEIVDRLTIKVTTKKIGWRLFLYFGGMAIYPAAECSIPGDQYLDEYNWKLMKGTGPYRMAADKDLKKGESLTLTRRDDWWAEDEPWARNTYNFRRIRFTVITDREIEYEKFKKGELDWFLVRRAQRWVEDIPKEPLIRRGLIQKRKIYNEAPQGYSGFAFNMRRPPFDDRRVRLAFAHLFNREQLIEKLFFNQYERINSLMPGRDWGAGDENEMIDFDPDRALELLAEAGYKERDADGYLVGPDGKRLSVTLPFGNQGWERIWLPVKEDYEAAGIEFELKLLDPSTLIKLIDDRQFTIYFQSWGALLFPNLETSFSSKLADQLANNNLCGYKNPKVDALFPKYDVEFDRKKQKEITREMDRLICADVPYAFGWYARYKRLLYWPRYGHPATYVTRIDQNPQNSMMTLWWYDAERTKTLERAQADPSITLPQYDGEGDERIVMPWPKK